MHITNQKLSFNIFTVGHLQNIFMEHDLYLMIFGIKKSIIMTYTMYCWLLLQIYPSDLKLVFVWCVLCVCVCNLHILPAVRQVKQLSHN